MSSFINNKRIQLEKVLTALESLDTGRPTPYHLPVLERPESKAAGMISTPHGEARPDIQSEARYNTINKHIDAIEAAKKSLRQELVYKLSPAETRVY